MNIFASIALLLSSLGAPSAFAGPVRDTLTARVLARIGSGADASVAFEGLEALALDGEGRVYVLDGRAHRLLSFTETGRHRWSFGREGDGPGEFLSPVGLAPAADQSLWVIDPESQRATVLAPDGTLRDTRRLPSGFTLSPWPGRFDRDGRLYHYLESGDASYDYDLAVYDADLERLATLRPPAAPGEESYFEGRTERGSHVRARIPFTPRWVWRLDSRGEFVSAWTADVRFFGSDGRPLPETGEWTSGPVDVTAADRAEALARLGRFVEFGGRVDEGRIPDHRPPLKTFVLDDRDRIWALIEIDDTGSTSVFEVFEPGGRPLGTVTVPVELATFPVPIVRGSRLVGVVRDAFDVEMVVVVALPELPD